MFEQLCKQHFPIILFSQPIFMSKTYKYAVTYNHASADGNLHLFRDQPYKKVLEKKFQVFNFTGVLSFTSVFEYFGHIFLTCFFSKFLIT